MSRPKNANFSEVTITEPGTVPGTVPEVQPETSAMPAKAAEVEKVTIGAGSYILRLEGLVAQVQKELEKVPTGDIPVKVVDEAADIRACGRRTYLFFMEKSSNPRDRIILVDAVGLEDLSRKVTDVYGKYRLIDIVSQPMNKRPNSKKVYLAIFVGE